MQALGRESLYEFLLLYEKYINKPLAFSLVSSRIRSENQDDVIDSSSGPAIELLIANSTADAFRTSTQQTTLAVFKPVPSKPV